nr:uncharacterized protein LOC104266486 [Ciona intestinalis]|eukprot:XP_009861128.1 uncharacterized protein LOC104266486 [Ciona intestinalis]
MSLFDILAFKLCQCGLYETVRILKEEEIESDVLDMITENMLFKIGVKPLGVRLRVLKLISQLPREIKLEVQENVPTEVIDVPTSSMRFEEESSGHTDQLRQDMIFETSTEQGKQISEVPETHVGAMNRYISHDEASMSSSSCENDESLMININSHSLVNELPSPIPYPNFSMFVLRAEKEGSVLSVRSHIIRECAVFYLALVPNLSKHYSPICRRIIQRFPQLMDKVFVPGKHRFMKLKKDLAQSVRNQRRPGRKNAPRGRGMHGKNFQTTKVVTRALLDKEVESFKMWMKVSKPSVGDVLKKYKMLGSSDWMVYQAGLLLQIPNFMEYMEDSLWNLFKSFHKLMMNTVEDETYDDDEQTELDRVAILQFIEQQVGTKSSILIEEGTVVSSSPQYVITKSCDGGISTARLMCDGQPIVVVQDPSVFLLLTMWISVHCVFNIPYSGCMVNLAQLIESIILMGKNQTFIYGNEGFETHHIKSEKMKEFLSKLNLTNMNVTDLPLVVPQDI